MIARLVPLLNFIAGPMWKQLFGHSADLLKGWQLLGGLRFTARVFLKLFCFLAEYKTPLHSYSNPCTRKFKLRCHLGFRVPSVEVVSVQCRNGKKGIIIMMDFRWTMFRSQSPIPPSVRFLSRLELEGPRKAMYSAYCR